jgi:hypothetical protein
VRIIALRVRIIGPRYSTVIPISLYITLEISKLAHAFFVNWDLDMYNAKIDMPAAARTSNLSDELGMVEAIFSDKTGMRTNLPPLSPQTQTHTAHIGTRTGWAEGGNHTPCTMPCRAMPCRIGTRD